MGRNIVFVIMVIIMIFGAGCGTPKKSNLEEIDKVNESEKADTGEETKSKTGKVIEKVPEKEQIEAGRQLDDNDKLIIGDIIQGAYIAEVQNQALLETDAGKNYFLLCYRYGGHLEELLAPYNVDGSSLQMTEEEINHLLEMAIGDRLDGKVEDIADGYLRMYAYVNGKFQELPVDADEFGMFGSGNIYVTAGMHQGYEISYFSFDGVNYSKLLGKFFVPGDERETDHYEINGNDVTKEEAIAYEKQLLEGIQDRRCYYGGEVLEEALYSDENVSVEFVEREKKWCNLEYQNVKEYLEAHMAE